MDWMNGEQRTVDSWQWVFVAGAGARGEGTAHPRPLKGAPARQKPGYRISNKEQGMMKEEGIGN